MLFHPRVSFILCLCLLFLSGCSGGKGGKVGNSDSNNAVTTTRRELIRNIQEIVIEDVLSICPATIGTPTPIANPPAKSNEGVNSSLETENGVVGPSAPTKLSEDSSYGDTSWSDLADDALSISDEKKVKYTPPTTVEEGVPHGVSHYLKATGFNLNIPEDATIDGIKVEIERSSASGNRGLAIDSDVRLIFPNQLGVQNKAKTSVYWPRPLLGEPEGYITYGDEKDTWGETELLPRILNDPNFGVAISARAVLNPAYIDHVKMSVSFHRPAGAVTVASIEKPVPSPTPSPANDRLSLCKEWATAHIRSQIDPIDLEKQKVTGYALLNQGAIENNAPDSVTVVSVKLFAINPTKSDEDCKAEGNPNCNIVALGKATANIQRADVGQAGFEQSLLPNEFLFSNPGWEITALAAGIPTENTQPIPKKIETEVPATNTNATAQSAPNSNGPAAPKSAQTSPPTSQNTTGAPRELSLAERFAKSGLPNSAIAERGFPELNLEFNSALLYITNNAKPIFYPGSVGIGYFWAPQNTYCTLEAQNGNTTTTILSNYNSIGGGGENGARFPFEFAKVGKAKFTAFCVEYETYIEKDPQTKKEKTVTDEAHKRRERYGSWEFDVAMSELASKISFDSAIPANAAKNDFGWSAISRNFGGSTNCCFGPVPELDKYKDDLQKNYKPDPENSKILSIVIPRWKLIVPTPPGYSSGICTMMGFAARTRKPIGTSVNDMEILHSVNGFGQLLVNSPGPGPEVIKQDITHVDDDTSVAITSAEKSGFSKVTFGGDALLLPGGFNARTLGADSTGKLVATPMKGDFEQTVIVTSCLDLKSGTYSSHQTYIDFGYKAPMYVDLLDQVIESLDIFPADSFVAKFYESLVDWIGIRSWQWKDQVVTQALPTGNELVNLLKTDQEKGFFYFGLANKNPEYRSRPSHPVIDRRGGTDPNVVLMKTPLLRAPDTQALLGKAKNNRRLKLMKLKTCLKTRIALEDSFRDPNDFSLNEVKDPYGTVADGLAVTPLLEKLPKWSEFNPELDPSKLKPEQTVWVGRVVLERKYAINRVSSTNLSTFTWVAESVCKEDEEVLVQFVPGELNDDGITENEESGSYLFYRIVKRPPEINYATKDWEGDIAYYLGHVPRSLKGDTDESKLANSLPAIQNAYTTLEMSLLKESPTQALESSFAFSTVPVVKTAAHCADGLSGACILSFADDVLLIATLGSMGSTALTEVLAKKGLSWDMWEAVKASLALESEYAPVRYIGQAIYLGNAARGAWSTYQYQVYLNSKLKTGKVEAFFLLMQYGFVALDVLQYTSQVKEFTKTLNKSIKQASHKNSRAPEQDFAAQQSSKQPKSPANKDATDALATEKIGPGTKIPAGEVGPEVKYTGCACAATSEPARITGEGPSMPPDKTAVFKTQENLSDCELAKLEVARADADRLSEMFNQPLTDRVNFEQVAQDLVDKVNSRALGKNAEKNISIEWSHRTTLNPRDERLRSHLEDVIRHAHEGIITEKNAWNRMNKLIDEINFSNPGGPAYYDVENKVVRIYEVKVRRWNQKSINKFVDEVQATYRFDDTVAKAAKDNLSKYIEWMRAAAERSTRQLVKEELKHMLGFNVLGKVDGIQTYTLLARDQSFFNKYFRPVTDELKNVKAKAADELGGSWKKQNDEWMWEWDCVAHDAETGAAYWNSFYEWSSDFGDPYELQSTYFVRSVFLEANPGLVVHPIGK